MLRSKKSSSMKVVQGPGGPLPTPRDGGSNKLHPLRNVLIKRHMSRHRFGSVSLRHFEVDDSLGGVLFCFKSFEDMERRIPHHCYALGDKRSEIEVEERTSRQKHSWRLDTGRHATVTGYFFSLRVPLYDTPLVLGLKEKDDFDIWTTGLRHRIETSATSRQLTMKVSKVEADSDGWGPDSKKAQARARKRASKGAMKESSDKATHETLSRVGVSVRNVHWSAIGVMIDHVEPGSPAAKAGLCAGEIIVCVDEKACLSHTHACRLLTDPTSGPKYDLLVCSEPVDAPWPPEPESRTPRPSHPSPVMRRSSTSLDSPPAVDLH